MLFSCFVLCGERMTLLLGPPSSGKSTLLLALAGKLDPQLKVTLTSSPCLCELFQFSVGRAWEGFLFPHTIKPVA